MDDAIRRSVERQFPELTGGYHLPRFGRVVAVPDAPAHLACATTSGRALASTWKCCCPMASQTQTCRS